MQSATANLSVVDSYLRAEIAASRVFGPVDPGVSTVQVIPIGLVPKNRQPGRWRLIVDLSSPRLASVNEGIATGVCYLSYVRVDKAARRLLQLGPGALMAKLDIESAYGQIPVHPDDRHLLGVRWKGVVYLDRAFPFGLLSAPKIFSVVADALLWIMYRRGITSGIYYLDDFLFFEAANSSECAEKLVTALRTCSCLGVSVAAKN